MVITLFCVRKVLKTIKIKTKKIHVQDASTLMSLDLNYR